MNGGGSAGDSTNVTSNVVTTSEVMAAALDFARRSLLAAAQRAGATTLHTALNNDTALVDAAVLLAYACIGALERRPNRAVQVAAAALLFDVCASLPNSVESPLKGRCEWLSRLATGTFHF